MQDLFIQNYPYKNKPFAHQQNYLAKHWKERNVALFADMGTGKSFMVINNIAMLYDGGDINAALIVAPKGVYRNWLESEIPKHMPAHVVHRMALWSPSPRKAESIALDSLFDITEDLKILIMNIEALSTDKGMKYAQRFLMYHKPFMAIDESTTIKTPKARRAKNAVKIGKLAKFRRILTGSPVTKSPLDLFQQCDFLSSDCLQTTSFYAFRARYAITIQRTMGNHSFQKVIGYQRLDELQEKLSEFAFRVTKEECLDLPPKMYVKREVALTPEQVRVYNEMKVMALASFKEGLSTTVNALTQLLRLHQIVCGHTKLDDGTVVEIPNNRIDEMLSVVEEASGKIIIWANYRHDIEAIKLALQKEYGMNSVATYYGDTEAGDRQQIVTSFQDPEHDLRFFVGNPRTGGYGLTLTAANVVIYYSNSFDLEVRLQSEDRAHRIGQTKSVTYVDLMSPKTVDEKIVKALRDKINIADQVMGVEDLRAWLI